MPKKLGSVFVTGVLVLVLAYLALALVQTTLDLVETKDWIAMYSLLIIILFSTAGQFPAFKKNKSGKWFVWLVLSGALFVGQLIKYILLNRGAGILFYGFAIGGTILVYFLKFRKHPFN